MTTAGQRICELRKALGLTQEQVVEAGRAAGYQLVRSELSKIETGANAASTERWRAIFSAAFGITREELAEYLDKEGGLEAALLHASRRGTIDAEALHRRLAELGAAFVSLRRIYRKEDGDIVQGRAEWRSGRDMEAIGNTDAAVLSVLIGRAEARDEAYASEAAAEDEDEEGSSGT